MTLTQPSPSVLRSPAGAQLRFLDLLDFFRRCIDSVTGSGVDRCDIGPRGSLRLVQRVGVCDACVCGVACGEMAEMTSVTRVCAESYRDHDAPVQRRTLPGLSPAVREVDPFISSCCRSVNSA